MNFNGATGKKYRPNSNWKSALQEKKEKKNGSKRGLPTLSAFLRKEESLSLLFGGMRGSSRFRWHFTLRKRIYANVLRVLLATCLSPADAPFSFLLVQLLTTHLLLSPSLSFFRRCATFACILNDSDINFDISLDSLKRFMYLYKRTCQTDRTFSLALSFTQKKCCVPFFIIKEADFKFIASLKLNAQRHECTLSLYSCMCIRWNIQEVALTFLQSLFFVTSSFVKQCF